jgi:hypothetical protein
MTEQNNFGVWAEFFPQGYSSSDYNLLRAHARIVCDNFRRGVRDKNMDLSDLQNSMAYSEDLNRWVNSAEGQTVLLALVTDIITHIKSVSHFGLPAHDARQVEFKDVAEGLRFLAMENPQGYQASFIIPMMCHDIGRLLEGRLYHPTENPHPNWIPHAQLSFLMLQKILDKPCYQAMPKELKQHYLYAVLQHSTENGLSFMSRAVQTCDRMQLIGAEGFFRGLSFFPCLMDADIAYPNDSEYAHDLPDMKGHRSLVSYLEFFARNMLDNLGEKHQAWQYSIARENIAILATLCDGDDKHSQELFERIFAPELRPHATFGPNKKPIPHPMMGEGLRLSDARLAGLKTREISPYELTDFICHELETPDGAAKLSPAMRDSLALKISALSSTDRNNLFRTVIIASEMRHAQDRLDATLCRDMTNDSALPPYIRAIANLGADRSSGLSQKIATTPATMTLPVRQLA